MKIIIINENGEPITVYHTPVEVVVRPKAKTVQIMQKITSEILHEYELIEKNLDWLESPENDTAEISLELKVKSLPKKTKPQIA